MSLDGAKLKIARAREHLEALDSAIREYIASDPSFVLPYRNENGDWGTGTHINEHPSPRFSLIVGDCLNNARSSLDYIIWELAGTYAGRVLDEGDRIYFPICDTPEKFDKWVADVAQYDFPQPLLDLLKSVQPFNAGYYSLVRLRTLVNVDKHKLLLTVKGEVKRIELTIQRRVTIQAGPEGEPEQEVWSRADVHVIWSDPSMPREPIQRTLDCIVECVEGILPQFDRWVI